MENKRLAASVKGMRPLTDDEVSVILDSFTGRYALRDRALFMLGIKSGFRISELLSLKVGDVWRDGKFLDRVNVARKNMKFKKKARQVPLHPAAKEALKVYLSGRQLDPDQPLFLSQKGGNIGRRQALHVLGQAYKFLEIERGVGTHGMRKTFANNVHEKLGRDIFRTKAALGHSDIRTTERYLSFRDSEIDEAILDL